MVLFNPTNTAPMWNYVHEPPFTNCVVSGKALPAKPYTFVRTGQEVKLCCKDCLAEFNKMPDHFMAKIP